MNSNNDDLYVWYHQIFFFLISIQKGLLPSGNFEIFCPDMDWSALTFAKNTEEHSNFLWNNDAQKVAVFREHWWWDFLFISKI